MNEEKLLALIPRHKSDFERANRLIRLGYSNVKSILPEIIEWTLDGNWPIARRLQDFLICIGKPVAPFIKVILQNGNSSDKYHLLSGVVAHSNELNVELYSELLRMSEFPTKEEISDEIDVKAKEILFACDNNNKRVFNLLPLRPQPEPEDQSSVVEFN